LEGKWSRGEKRPRRKADADERQDSSSLAAKRKKSGVSAHAEGGETAKKRVSALKRLGPKVKPPVTSRLGQKPLLAPNSGKRRGLEGQRGNNKDKRRERKRKVSAVAEVVADGSTTCNGGKTTNKR